MRPGSMIAAAFVTMLAAAPAAAEDGRYANPLRRMLTETAAGTCPADLMGDQLLAACRAQLPKMQPALAAGGAITAVDFVKGEGEGVDRVESYSVKFAKGTTAVWQIGKFSDGKFQAAWSAG